MVVKDQKINELSVNQVNSEILEHKEKEINSLRNDLKNLTDENASLKKSVDNFESDKNSLNEKLNESTQRHQDLNNQ
jgi:hypothetical protein